MTTAVASARYRTPPLLGSFLGVDRKAEVIRGVAIMQRGNIAEQDVRQQFVDDATFSQFLQMASSSKGIKGRFTHPDMSSDGLGTYLGRWKSPRVDGDVMRADLHISPRSHESPNLGDVGKYVLDLAESDPDMFGASMATLLDEPAMKRDERGDGYQPIRLRQLFAIDIVDSPALTHNGLFSSTDGLPDQVSSLLDSHFAGVPQDQLRQRAEAYLDRYLNNRYGVLRKEGFNMASENNAPAVSQESIDAAIEKALGAAVDKFSGMVDERISKAIADLKPQEHKPSEIEVERKRCSDLFATAKNAGLEGYEKIAQEAIDKGLTLDQFKASVADRLIAQNNLSKDHGDTPADPEAKYKAEYAKGRAAFTQMGVTEAEYITSRKIEDGTELLAPEKFAA